VWGKMKNFKSINILLASSVLLVPIAITFQNFSSVSTPNFSQKNATLDDLYNGKAFFRPVSQAEEVSLAHAGYLPQEQKKLQIFKDFKGNLISIVRGYHSYQSEIEKVTNYKLYVAKADESGLRLEIDDSSSIKLNSVTSVQNPYGNQRDEHIFKGKKIIIDGSEFPELDYSFYDPHVVLDENCNGSVIFCRSRFLMTFECAGPGLSPSVCVSYSTEPRHAKSWTNPVVLIKGTAKKSASTGITLPVTFTNYGLKFTRYLIKFTIVDDGNEIWDEGSESASSYSYSTGLLPSNKSIGTVEQLMLGRDLNVMLKADSNIYCFDRFDCNNQDVMDLVRENNKTYAFYHGSNFFRVERNDPQLSSNSWNVGLARVSSTSDPRGNQQEYQKSRLKRPVLESLYDDNGIHGIAYPAVNLINGKYYLYYTSGSKNDSSQNKFYRSELVKKDQLNSPDPFSSKCAVNMPDLFIGGAQGSFLSKLHGIYCRVNDRLASEDEFQSWRNHKNSKIGRSFSYIDLVYFLSSQDDYGNKWNLSEKSDSQFIHFVFARSIGRAPSADEYTFYHGKLPEKFKTLSLARRKQLARDLITELSKTDEFKYKFGSFLF
jgi:hypothetical protein